MAIGIDFDINLILKGMPQIKELEDLINELKQNNNAIELTIDQKKAIKVLENFSNRYENMVKKLSGFTIENIFDAKSVNKQLQGFSNAFKSIKNSFNILLDDDLIGGKQTLEIKDMVDGIDSLIAKMDKSIGKYFEKYGKQAGSLNLLLVDTSLDLISDRDLKNIDDFQERLSELERSITFFQERGIDTDFIDESTLKNANELYRVLADCIDLLSGKMNLDDLFQDVSYSLKELGINANDFENNIKGIFNANGGGTDELSKTIEKLKDLMKSTKESLDGKEFIDVDSIDKAKQELITLRSEVERLGGSLKELGLNKSMTTILSQLSKTKNKLATSFSSEEYENIRSSTQANTTKYLKDSGYDVDGNIVGIKRLESGLVKVDAKIRDVDGNWQKFSATVTKSGKLINEAFSPITGKQKDKLEAQMAETVSLSMDEIEAEIKRVRNALDLSSEKWNISVDNSGIVTITEKISELDSTAKTTTQTFINADEAIANFNSTAARSKVSIGGTSDDTKDYEKKLNQIISLEKKLNDLRIKSIGSDQSISKNDITAEQIEKQIAALESEASALKVSTELIDKYNQKRKEAQDYNKDLYDASYVESINKKATSLLSQFDSDKISSLDSAQNKISGYGDAVKQIQQQYADLISYINSHDLNLSENMDEATVKAKELSDALKLVDSGIYDMNNSQGKYFSGLSNDIAKARQEVEKYVQGLKGVDSQSLKWNKQGTSLSYNVDEGFGKITTNYANIVKYADGITQMRTASAGAENGISKLGRALSSIGSSGADFAASMVGMYIGTEDFIQYVRSGIDVLKEYDAALTDISYTTEGSVEQIDAMGRSYVQLAKDMSSSVADSMEVASIYANLQTSEAEIMQSVRPTLMLSNATGVDAATAADQIQGVLEQFDLATEQSEHIVDVFESISSNVKLDFSDAISTIAEGVSVAGQTAADAGMTFEELASVIAQVAETTRDGGSEIGNSIRTMLTRISKASTMADDVDNETINAAAASLDSIGIKVYETDGTFRDFTQIISELNEQWSDLTDSQQARKFAWIFRNKYQRTYLIAGIA